MKFFRKSIRNALYSAPNFIEWFIVKNLDFFLVKTKKIFLEVTVTVFVESTSTECL